MTQQAELVKTWCLTCGTMHGAGDECPGELLATGPEGHGWRVLVDTPQGPEVYGSLVAPAGDRWRARILTYPNVLWIIPRGNTPATSTTSVSSRRKRRRPGIRPPTRSRNGKRPTFPKR